MPKVPYFQLFFSTSEDTVSVTPPWTIVIHTVTRKANSLAQNTFTYKTDSNSLRNINSDFKVMADVSLKKSRMQKEWQQLA